jgi:hypothetical protein
MSPALRNSESSSQQVRILNGQSLERGRRADERILRRI